MSVIHINSLTIPDKKQRVYLKEFLRDRILETGPIVKFTMNGMRIINPTRHSSSVLGKNELVICYGSESSGNIELIGDIIKCFSRRRIIRYVSNSSVASRDISIGLTIVEDFMGKQCRTYSSMTRCIERSINPNGYCNKHSEKVPTLREALKSILEDSHVIFFTKTKPTESWAKDAHFIEFPYNFPERFMEIRRELESKLCKHLLSQLAAIVGEFYYST